MSYRVWPCNVNFAKHRIWQSYGNPTKGESNTLPTDMNQKRDRVRNLVSTTLWKHYCNLPTGFATERIVEATRTKYENGAMVPINPAPSDWVDQVQAELKSMINAAGEAANNFIMGPEPHTAPAEEAVLVYWRELAVWLMHFGPYKGKTRDLGLLAEVLGVAEKGTFWKG